MHHKSLVGRFHLLHRDILLKCNKFCSKVLSGNSESIKMEMLIFIQKAKQNIGDVTSE